MAVTDYSTTADDNTTISGLSISDATVISTVDNIIRQMMADTREFYDDTIRASAIGSTVQAYDAGLNSIAAQGTAANKMLYTTGADTYAETDISSFGRSLIDDATAEDARTTLGLPLPNNADLSVDGASVARRDNVKTYADGIGLKAWACITYSGGTPTVQSSLNILSVTDNGVGDITVTMNTALADTNYAVVATVAGTASTGVRGVFEIAADRTTSAFRLEINTTSSASDLSTDPDILSIMVMR